MTATITRIERSGPSIREALVVLSPGEAAQFVADYRAALTRAVETLDLTDTEAVLTRWWGIATIRANPLTPAEQELVRRVRAGEDLPVGSPLAEDPRP